MEALHSHVSAPYTLTLHMNHLINLLFFMDDTSFNIWSNSNDQFMHVPSKLKYSVVSKASNENDIADCVIFNRCLFMLLDGSELILTFGILLFFIFHQRPVVYFHIIFINYIITPLPWFKPLSCLYPRHFRMIKLL